MNISRRLSAIGMACGLALGLAGLAGTAQAQTAMRINISVAKDSHQGVAIDTFAQEVEKRTGGRYKIQTFYSGSLGGERESVEAVHCSVGSASENSAGVFHVKHDAL